MRVTFIGLPAIRSHIDLNLQHVRVNLLHTWRPATVTPTKETDEPLSLSSFLFVLVFLLLFYLFLL